MGDPLFVDFGAVCSISDRLQAWLRESALPLWELHGIDRRAGGFFETLTFDPVAQQIVADGGVRRGRVVARQIYSFAVGSEIGCPRRSPDPVDHGREYLLSHLLRGDGLFHTSVHAISREPVGDFSLYEHAFYLFALAAVAGLRDGHASADLLASTCLQRLRAYCGKPGGGFYESNPPTLPLKSNPHMHLLEAALAWIDVTKGSAQKPWVALAREIVGVCLTYFVDAQTGAVREYFDDDWRAMPGDLGRVVEPGHQFEWAWLLFQWAASGHVDSVTGEACMTAARTLVEIGERWGVDATRDVAINEISDDMSIKDAAAKIWPQTERLKAWCAMLSAARSANETETACRKITQAGNSLARYLLAEPAGLWHEVWSADGSFAAGPSKASSLYHIACAISALRRTSAGQLRSGVVPPRERSAGLLAAP